jgi:hypothetical protein
MQLALWQAGTQQAAPLPSIFAIADASDGGLKTAATKATSKAKSTGEIAYVTKSAEPGLAVPRKSKTPV